MRFCQVGQLKICIEYFMLYIIYKLRAVFMYSEACESSYLNSFTAQSTCYIIRAVSQLAWYLCQSDARRK